ncbi:MAG: monofunctional biosynthetic peptidoglycan transglycosylase [Paracoccus denitrificans]|nr:MAG: monofunctional biosynthetic peptidoglycan transglycosylase [Paracoccus denitrificans]PZO84936.1 MAG: monofunctional biosynthetic peptidoglycan transglycosylase [Paracoccus denitrificans]
MPARAAPVPDDPDAPLIEEEGRRPAGPLRRLLGWVLRWVRWIVLRVLAVMAVLVLIFSVFNPPTTWTILRQATEPRGWTSLSEMAPVVPRAVVAAEDANFCSHWGFDMIEIRRVIASGSNRGASTITQQTAKNVFLWQGRSWTRKLLETTYTPMIEALWSKSHILEVYLNVAEFGPGVFGIRAAAAHHFKTTPDKLTARQAAALAMVLPNPKERVPRTGSARARAIADGAATIAADGRAQCFQVVRPNSP